MRDHRLALERGKPEKESMTKKKEENKSHSAQQFKRMIRKRFKQITPSCRRGPVEGFLWCWRKSDIEWIGPRCPLLCCRRIRLWMWKEAGWKKTFAVVLQHCSEVECLCIDWADRENREIFHMFISRTPRNKQPSLGLSVLPTQGSASAGYKNPSVSRWASIIVAKSTQFKRQLQRSVAFVLLSALFIHQICTRCTEEALHHLSFTRAIQEAQASHVIRSETSAGVSRTIKSDSFNVKTHFHIKVKTLTVQCKNMSSGDQSNQLDYMLNVFHLM